MVTADRLDFQRGVQTEPLSDRDIEMIHRYLSDPSVFPREFKRWVTEHSSDTVDIAKTQVHGLVNSTGQVVIGGASVEMLGATLCGFAIPFAGVTPPAGWLLCDGHEELRATYSVLFNLIGTSWGTPSAGDKFKLPDLRGRTVFGVDSNVPFAQTDPMAAGARGPKHYHRFVDTKSFTAGGTNTLDGSTDWEGDHQHDMYASGHGAAQDPNQFQSIHYLGYEGGAVTNPNGGHDHGVSVSGWVNVSGSVTVDNNTDQGAVGPKDAVGWAGMSWIVGSGKVPA